MSTVEFYTLCRQRLTTDGVLVANFLASDPYFLSRLKGLQQVFPMIYVNPLPVGNILVYASANTTLDHDALIARAMQVQETHHFAFPFAMRSLDLRQNLYAQFAGLALADPFFDQSPPDDYFDLLPGSDAFFTPVAADAPCFCGSGLPFGDCHGRQNQRNNLLTTTVTPPKNNSLPQRGQNPLLSRIRYSALPQSQAKTSANRI
jgi:hypothetical protein